MPLYTLNKGYQRKRKHQAVKAWVVIGLLLFNQLALALHVHDPDDHARVHQCAVCVQLQSGEHALPVNHDFRLPESFSDGFYPLDFNIPFIRARLAFRSRAPPVVSR